MPALLTVSGSTYSTKPLEGSGSLVKVNPSKKLVLSYTLVWEYEAAHTGSAERSAPRLINFAEKIISAVIRENCGRKELAVFE
jgi:hypothetical protein